MAKKTSTVNIDKRTYPIKVRLMKPNPANEDCIVYNRIKLYTYKDTVIDNVETLMKIQPMERYLIIKSDVAESKTEVVEDKNNEEI